MDVPSAEIQYAPCDEAVTIGQVTPTEEFTKNIFHFAQNRLGSEACIIEDCSFVVWTSSALGVPERGKHYLCVMVPGYRVLVRVGEDRIALHTDLEGRQIVVAKW